MYKLGWFSTGRGKGSRGLLKVVQDSIKSGEIEAEIAFVFCSREPGESEATDIFIKMAQDYHIPLVCFSCQKFKAKQEAGAESQAKELPPWRLEYDREVMRRLEDLTPDPCALAPVMPPLTLAVLSRLAGLRPDLCVLAGYMLIVGKEMCSRYDMINLHPAAPGGPAGTWQEVIWQLIESGAKKTGVMMHLVTPELDKGPPVSYCTFPISGQPFDKYWDEIREQPLEQIKKSQGEKNRLFRLIREHGFARELPLVVATLKAFSQGKVKITADKRVADAKGRPIGGYNLTDEINEAVKGVLSP